MSLAVGDFTADGRADLAVGSTGADVQIFRGAFTKASEGIGAAWQTGTVTLLRGSAAGLTGAGSTRWTQRPGYRT
ncbi:hypothetical protein AB0N16_18350 [Streptomyces sp. NPDC051105]|uniref:hypothetical protein n=1 Tax=Streptomyces sp. NPDC051105 TaxID=3154843 RepID=UPI003432EBDA